MQQKSAWLVSKTLLFSLSDKWQDFAWKRQQTYWNIVHKLSPGLSSYLQKLAYCSKARIPLKLDLYPIFLSRETPTKRFYGLHRIVWCNSSTTWPDTWVLPAREIERNYKMFANPIFTDPLYNFEYIAIKH